MRVVQGILKPEYIEIYGIDIPEDTRGAGYNLGDLLNMPHLANCWNAHPHHTNEDLERMYLVGERYVGSVLSYYIELRPYSEVVPFIPRVIGAVRKYAEKNRHNWTNVIKSDGGTMNVLMEVSDKENLCVHIRSGDKEVEPAFLDLIKELSLKYKNIYIMCGLHLDQYFTRDADKISRFSQSMEYILRCNENIRLVLADPDEHMCLMYEAANLLIHKGGFSVLGSIVNQGQLYVTPLMETVRQQNWKLYVDRPFVTIPI